MRLDEDAFNPMEWTRPEYGKSKIGAAGKILAARKQPHEGMSLTHALDIAGNWRSSHGYPLHVAYCRLRDRVRKNHPDAIVAQRLKRLRSIVAKLQVQPTMQLANMYDLGGCRAVVDTLEDVREIVSLYEAKPLKALKIVGKKDYIETPRKDTGYRSVHLVLEYQSDRESHSVYNGCKVEMQIRTRLQHIWATAVEIVDTFKSQKLKSGLGDPEWQSFFKCLAAVLDDFEPPVRRGRELISYIHALELSEYMKTLNVIHVIAGIHAALPYTEKPDVAEAQAFLMVLDSKTEKTKIAGLGIEESASKEYLRLEKEHFDNPNVQVVLASAGAVKKPSQGIPELLPRHGGTHRAIASRGEAAR